MSIEKQLSPQQWKAVYNAPMAAATFVATASGGGFELVTELYEVRNFITREMEDKKASVYGELVDDLLATMKHMSRDEAKEIVVEYQNAKDLDLVHGQTRQTVADAWAAVASLPGSAGFAQWLLELARRAAEAKTGGLLGLGGASVIDEKEQAALNDLAAVLGVAAN